jgi:hypothetical protein
VNKPAATETNSPRHSKSERGKGSVRAVTISWILRIEPAYNLHKLMLLAPVNLKLGALAVITVTLWLGGFGCSLCCATGATDSCCLDTVDSLRQMASSGAIRSNTTSDDAGCCKPSATVGKSSPTGPVLKHKGTIGCSLLPSKLEGITADPRLTDGLVFQGTLPESPYLLDTKTHTSHHVDASLPRNRGGPYLRFCVLLI